MTPSDPQSPSWRAALLPGERHGFWRDPGWYDLRENRPDGDELERCRWELLWALPPLGEGAAVLDVAAGTGTMVAMLARFVPSARFTLLDGYAPSLARAEAKLRAEHPTLAPTFLCREIDPLANEPLPGGPYRLAISSIALHDIAPPAAPDDPAGRARHREAHVGLLRRVLGALEPGGHVVYADAMRPRFRVAEHLHALEDAGFDEVDVAWVSGRLLVCGGRRPVE